MNSYEIILINEMYIFKNFLSAQIFGLKARITCKNVYFILLANNHVLITFQLKAFVVHCS